jgi:hypothetical protein
VRTGGSQFSIGACIARIVHANEFFEKIADEYFEVFSTPRRRVASKLRLCA